MFACYDIRELCLGKYSLYNILLIGKEIYRQIMNIWYSSREYLNNKVFLGRKATSTNYFVNLSGSLSDS